MRETERARRERKRNIESGRGGERGIVRMRVRVRGEGGRERKRFRERE